MFNTQELMIGVLYQQPGDIYNLGGSVQISVIAYNSTNSVINWMIGTVTQENTTGWTFIQSRAWLPEQTTKFVFRVTGFGKTNVWVDDLSVSFLKNLPISHNT